MMRKMFVVVLSFIFFGSGFGVEGVIRSAYAQEKKAASKKEVKEAPAKKKAEVAKEKAEEISLPDGTVGRRYDFVLTPANLAAPYKISIVSGSLPQGFSLNQKTGGIEGEPKQAGEWGLTIRVVDAKGKKGLFAGTIRVWRMLTIGEHGQFKGFDGLQMAMNMAQDMDEIRIEKGTIEASGLIIPANKAWEHGIKISGGWNETYEEKGNKPEETSLDGGGAENRILTISNSRGRVAIENLKFTNSKGGAVQGNANYTNCTFTNNSDSNGGAVKGNGAFINCTFTNNSATFGGAVSGGGTFINCTFTNNSATGTFGSGNGGAVSGGGTFINCTFTNNSATDTYGSGGGAVKGNGTFTNCTFTNNSASNGGAVSGGGTFTNCTFTNNSAEHFGGAVFGNGTYINSIFTNNSADSGGAVSGNGTFSKCTFTNNSAGNDGGAVNGDGTFTNSIFINNSANNGGAVKGNGYISVCTLYGNKAKESGGAFSGGGWIFNSIFYKNTAAEKDNDITVNGNLEIDFSLVNYLSGAANYGANNIMGDPKFAAPDNGDLRLRSDSPAIDKGKPLQLFKQNPKDPKGKPLPMSKKDITTYKEASKDLDGKPRYVGSEIDMGAYEWQGKDYIQQSKTALATELQKLKGEAEEEKRKLKEKAEEARRTLPGKWHGRVDNEEAALVITLTQEGNQIYYAGVEEELAVEIEGNGQIVLKGVSYKRLSGEGDFILDTFYGNISADGNSITGDYVDARGNRGEWSVTKKR